MTIDKASPSFICCCIPKKKSPKRNYANYGYTTPPTNKYDEEFAFDRDLYKIYQEALKNNHG